MSDDTIRLVAQEIKDLVGYCPSHPRKSDPAMTYAKYLFYKKLSQIGFSGRSATKFIYPERSVNGTMSNYYLNGRYVPPNDMTAKYGWYIGEHFNFEFKSTPTISGSDELLAIFNRMTPESREKLLNQARTSYRVYKQERIKQLKQQINGESTKV